MNLIEATPRQEEDKSPPTAQLVTCELLNMVALNEATGRFA